jgi:hypothetical protein
MKVPGFLLRRLYVKGSLRNENGGFAFDLKNSLGSGYAEQVLPLSIDGVEVPAASARFVVDGEARTFAAVTAEQPMTLAMNRVVTIAVDGAPLPPGKHKIDIGFVVTGMGELRFDVTDAIGGDDGGDAA